MWNTVFPPGILLAAAVMGLLPLANFALVLFRGGAPDPRDREPSPFDWLFPLRGRWRRIFFLAVQFLFLGTLVYCVSVMLSLMLIAFGWMIVSSVLEFGGR